MGTRITADTVKVVAWPERTPLAGGFSSVEQVLERGLISGVVENEPLTESKLAPKEAGAGLPPSIPTGMRAMSVKVNEVIGVAGFVVPGTHVDVMVILQNEKANGLARVVVSNVQVLTAGTRYDQENARKDGKPIPSTVVTLMVNPFDAEKIALAQAEGQLMLSLRNPLDTAPTDSRGARTATLFAGSGPASSADDAPRAIKPRPLPAAVPPPPPPATKAYTVEAIRAAKRTEEVGTGRERALVGGHAQRTQQEGFHVRIGRLVVLTALGVVWTTQARTSALAPTGEAQQAPAAPAVQRVPLTAGRSTVLSTEFEIVRIAVTNPAVADAVVVQPREVLIDGKAPGTVSLIIWGSTERVQYDVVVEPAINTLEQRLQALFPGEDIHVSANDEAIILSGRVSSNIVSLRAAEIAAATSSKAKVVNLLQLPGGAESQQVLLQVRFAEVSRQALRELGVSIFTSPTGINNTIGRVTTGQFAAPGFTGLRWTKASGDFGSEVTSAEGEFTFSDFLNIFILNQQFDIGAAIRALQNKGSVPKPCRTEPDRL